MREFKYQVKISEELADFLDYLEVYDSAASVGVVAFSNSDALVLRYLIDQVENRSAWHKAVKSELLQVKDLVSSFEIQEEYEQIPIIYPRNDSLPEYYLEFEEIVPWLTKLYKVVAGVKGSNALP